MIDSFNFTPSPYKELQFANRKIFQLNILSAQISLNPGDQPDQMWPWSILKVNVQGYLSMVVVSAQVQIKSLIFWGQGPSLGLWLDKYKLQVNGFNNEKCSTRFNYIHWNTDNSKLVKDWHFISQLFLFQIYISFLLSLNYLPWRRPTAWIPRE